MKHTMQFSVGGQTMDVSADEQGQFLDAVKTKGLEAQQVHTYRVGDQTMTVADNEVEDFKAAAEAKGMSPSLVRRVTMDDGQELTLDDYALNAFINARRTGQTMSRGLLKQAGIPESYGKTRESREALADQLSELFPEEKIEPQFVPFEMNDADYVKLGLDKLTEGMKSLPALDKKVTDALLNNPIIDNILMKKGTTVGDWLEEGGLAQEMVKGGNDFSNALVGKILSLGPAAADVLAKATRLVSPEQAEVLNKWADEKRAQIAEALPTDTANLETGSELGNKVVQGAKKFTNDTLATVGTFAIPGAAAVDISAGTAKTYWDAIAEAKKNGASDEKAEAMAAIKAGIGAVEGIILAGAAKGAKNASAFTNALKKSFVTGAKGAATRGASDLVQQGIEGAENPDLIRTGEEAAKGGAEMAAFDLFASAVHGVQAKAFDGGKKEAAKRAQERKEAEAKAKTKAEAEKAAKERFDAKLSDEAMSDIDKTIEKQVAAETIPSWRHAEEVKRRAIEKLGKRENGESHEAVEQAVIEAADEVNARLQKTERVETASLERRQAEYEMKLNEAKAKREAEKKKFGKAKTPLPEKPVEPVAEKPVEIKAREELSQWYRKNYEPDDFTAETFDDVVGKLSHSEATAYRDALKKENELEDAYHASRNEKIHMEWRKAREELSDFEKSLGIEWTNDEGWSIDRSLPEKKPVEAPAPKSAPKEVVSKTETPTSADAVKSAQKLLGTKFYQDEAALKREMAKLPPQATKAREAYETALAEARKRAEAEKSANAEEPKTEIKTPVAEPPNPTRNPTGTAAKREKQDATYLRSAIAEAKKKVIDIPAKSGIDITEHPDFKTFSVKIGTTTVNFTNTKEGIARAEKIAKKLETVTKWTVKNPSDKTPSAPKPVKIAAKGKEATLNDVSPLFVANGKEAKTRPSLAKPFVQGGHIYATNGRVAIRMEAEPGMKDTEGAPNAKEIYDIRAKNANTTTLKVDVGETSVALEEASAVPKKDEVKSVELWVSPDGKLVMRSRNTGDMEPADSAYINAPNLKGHSYIGEYNLEYVSDIVKTFADLGAGKVDVEFSKHSDPLRLVGGGAEVLLMPLNGSGREDKLAADTKTILFGGKRVLTDAERKAMVESEIAELKAKLAKEKSKENREAIYNTIDIIRANEAKVQEQAGKHDPLYSPNKPLGEGLVDTAAELERIAKAEAEGETSGGNQGLPARSYSWGEGSGKGRFDHFVSKNSIINLAKKQFPQFAFRGEGTTRIGANYNGHWEPYREIIRSKDMASIDTIPHEIGHGIDSITRKSALAMPMEVRKELVKFGRQLYGDQKPNGGYTGEGFAEYIRGRICGADNLEAEAPNLHKWFNTVFAKKHPEIVRKIDLLQNEVTLYRQQTSAEKVAAFMKPSVSKTEKVMNSVKNFFSSDNWLDDGAVLTRGIKSSGIDKMFKWQPEFRELEKLSKTDPKKRTVAEQSRIDNLTASVSDKIQNDPRILQDLFRGTSSTRAIEMSKSGVTNLFGTKKLGNVTGFDKSGKAIRDNDTKSESEIFQDFSRKELADWDAYAIAKVGLENYVNEGYRFGVERDTLETTIKKLESPKFEKALEEYTKFSRRVLSIGLESGALSREDYEAITGAHKYYVRIERRFEDKANGLGGSQSSPLHKIKGSVRNVLPPRTATMIQNERLIRHFQAAKILNSIGRAVQSGEIANTNAQRRKGGDTYAIGANLPVRVPNAQEAVSFTSEKLRKDFVKRAGVMFENRGEADPNMMTITKGGKVVTEGESMAEKMYEELYGESGDKLTIFREKPSKGKNGLVSTYIDGKLVTFELPDEAWGKYITGLETRGMFKSEGAKTAWKMATATSRSLRLGATIINPAFAMTNAARDTVHAAVMSNAGLTLPGWNVIRGVYDILHGSESKKLFEAMGGAMQGYYGIGKEESYKAASREVAAKLRPADRMVAKLYNPVSNGIGALSEVLSVAEIAPRLAEMDAVIKRARSVGIPDDAASILGFLSAKDVSIDFGKRGKAMKYVNDLMPYANAWIRGLEQMARKMGVGDALPHEFEERKGVRAANTVGRSLLFITLPAVAAAIATMQTSSDDEKEAIFKKEPREKWDFDDSLGVRIAQPFELGSIFHAMAKAAVYEYYGDEGAMQEAALHGIESNILRFKNPEDIARGISFISPWLDIAMNRDYKGSPIVSPLIKDTQEAKNWKDFSTTPIAETLGEWFDIAPAYIDHVANAYTGGTWKRWMSPAADNSIMTITGLSAFRPRPTARRDVSEFYEFADKSLRKSNSGRISLEDYGKLKRAEKLKDELSQDFKEARELRKLSLSHDEANERRTAIMKRIYAKIKKWEDESKSDREIGIRKAVDELTNPNNADNPQKLEKAKAILKDVDPSEIEYQLIQYGRERVNDGKGRLKLRWSNDTILKRIYNLRKMK